MLNFLPAVLVGVIASLLMAINALFWVPILLVFALIKLVVPIPAFRRAIAPVLLAIAEAWISCNSGWMALTQRTEWDVSRHRRAGSAAGTWSTATTSPGSTSSCCSTC
jgi:hypothetical protein